MKRESRRVLITGYVHFLQDDVDMAIKRDLILPCSAVPQVASVSHLRKSSSGEVSQGGDFESGTSAV